MDVTEYWIARSSRAMTAKVSCVGTLHFAHPARRHYFLGPGTAGNGDVSACK